METIWGVFHAMLKRIRSTCTGLLGLCLLACNADMSTPPSLEHVNEALYVRLEVNHRAVLMSTVAPYDTVRLTTIPMGDRDTRWRPAGLSEEQLDSMLRANPPRFISRDSTRVRVSADGLLQAVRATTATGTVQIIATQQVGLVTHACTTLVRALAVANPQPLKRLVLTSADSLKVAAQSSIPLVVTGFDEAEARVNNLVTYVQSSDSRIAWGTNGTGWNKTAIQGRIEYLGQAAIRVTAFAFGASITDSIVVRNGYPVTAEIALGTVWVDKNKIADWKIGPGGTVGFLNDSTDKVYTPNLDVVFETPEFALAALAPTQNTGGGNIIGLPHGDLLAPREQNTRYRRFLTPGIYVYRVIPRNIVGRIIVGSQ